MCSPAGIVQDGDVAVRFEMSHCGHHFGVGKRPRLPKSPRLRRSLLKQRTQFLRTNQHPFAVSLFFERQHIILDALEGDGGHSRGHLIPRDLRLEFFEQSFQPFAAHGAGAEIAALDAVTLAELIEVPAVRARARRDPPRADQHRGRKFAPCP